MVMYRLTFLGPALEMHAGGLAWKKGESHDFDDQHTARRMMTRYRYAEWELEEVGFETATKPASSKRQGRKKTEPKPKAEVESEPPQLAVPLVTESPSPSEEEE